MSEYDNTNSGVLFANNYKEDGDSRPDFVGSLDVNGTEYRLAGWKNTSKAGKRYISVKVEDAKPKDEEDDSKKEKEELPF
jgi:uncharacterized protein (DUF736 family)|tara:strand:- start:477 stop:716 length:240 start_codon:yes stop_codon:yes gene_type:complete